MNTVLYFSPDDVVYETRAYSNADIAELVHDCGLESLTSADQQFDFWLTPSTRRCRHQTTGAQPKCFWPQPRPPLKQCRCATAELWSPPTTQPASSMGS